jgi:hypothetical protein
MKDFSNLSEDLTSGCCETRRPTNLHIPSQHQRLNNTSTSPPTAIKFLLKRESRRMKTSTTMANHDPRMNRTNPKYRELLGIFGTWSTSCDFCTCLLFALCVLDSVLQLSCVFLIVFAVVLCVSCMCVELCAHDWPGLFALQTRLANKTPSTKPLKDVFPSHLTTASRVAQMR